MDILVSWQVSGAVHTLVGYTLAEEQPVEIMRSGYSQYLATDLDGDGKEEIVLAQAESGSKAQLRIEYYDGRDGIMELTSTAPCPRGPQASAAGPMDSWKGRFPRCLSRPFWKGRAHYRRVLPGGGPRAEEHRHGPGDPPQQECVSLLRGGPAGGH
ncbi:MAG: hypothetical protein ACLR1T_08115 [Evtepia gabavorous]